MSNKKGLLALSPLIILIALITLFTIYSVQSGDQGSTLDEACCEKQSRQNHVGRQHVEG